jgi:hypothetical protein
VEELVMKILGKRIVIENNVRCRKGENLGLTEIVFDPSELTRRTGVNM